MNQEFYKKFVEKFLKKSIDSYVNYMFKDENGNYRLEIYTSTKREYEERIVFIFGKDFCEFKNDYVEFNLSEQWKKYLQEETRKNNALKQKPKKDFREFCYKVNGERFFGLKMPTYKLEGQEISTFEFFKRELEKMTNCKLRYVRYISPFIERRNIYENYDTFGNVYTREYEFLMPDWATEAFCTDNDELAEEKNGYIEYERTIKNSDCVFVLNRNLLNGVRGEDYETSTNNRVFYLEFDDYGENLLQYSIYKKDKKYDEIILKTLNYHAKSVNKSLDLVNLDKIKGN